MGSPSAAAAKDDSATETDPTTDFIGDTRRDSGSDTESNTDCDGDDLPPPLPDLSQFEEGERVLAKHSDCFYEAKVNWPVPYKSCEIALFLELKCCSLFVFLCVSVIF